jgi:hypothetical protein
MANHRFPCFAAVLVTALGFLGAARPASATSIFVSYLELTNGYEIVSLDENGTTVTGNYAGQLDLTANLGTSLNPGYTFHLYGWCVDMFHDIYLGSDSDVYTVAPTTQINTDPGSPSGSTLSSAQAAQITWLASYGNSILATQGPDSEFSAAVQIAIWNAEYGYTYVGSDSTLSNDLSNLASLYATDPGAYPVNSDTVAFVSQGSVSQGLTGIAPAPEPASFVLLAGGLLALGALRCRRAA